MLAVLRREKLATSSIMSILQVCCALNIDRTLEHSGCAGGSICGEGSPRRGKFALLRIVFRYYTSTRSLITIFFRVLLDVAAVSSIYMIVVSEEHGRIHESGSDSFYTLLIMLIQNGIDTRLPLGAAHQFTMLGRPSM